MAVAQGIITARGGATSHAAVVARQIGKPCVAGLARSSIVDYARRSSPARRHRHRVRRGRLGQPRRLDRRALRRRPADGRGPLRGPAGAPDDPRLGRRVPAAWASGRTPTSPRRPPRRGATAPRASASAGPSTCSARASGSRSSAARSSSPTRRRGQGRARRRRDAHRGRDGDDRRVRRRDGQARGAPAGRLRGHLRGDGRPAGRHPADRPAAPRVPAEPRGAARQGHPGRASRRRTPRRTATCSRRSSRCTSRTRCSACAAAGSG